MLPYAMMNFRLRSNAGLIIKTARKELYEERQIKKVIKRLKKFTPKRLGKIQRKYLKKKKLDQEGLNKEIRELAQEFLKEYKEYRQYLKDIIEMFKEVDIASARQEAVTLNDAEQIIEDIIRKKNLRFPAQAKKEFIKQYRKHMKNISKMIKKSKKSDIKIIHKLTPKVSVLRKIAPLKKLTKEERKEAYKVAKGAEGMKTLDEMINIEIKNGVRQDFLILLIRYWKNLQTLDSHIEVVQQDLKMLVSKEMKEFSKVGTKLKNFIILIAREEGVRSAGINTKTIENDLEALNNLKKDFAKKDWHITHYLQKLLDVLNSREEELNLKIKAIK